MFRNLDNRHFFRFEDQADLHKRITKSFTEAAEICKMYAENPQALVPNGILVPRVIHLDIEKEFDMDEVKIGSTLKVNHKHLF